ncbi:hypothetical protein, partial [Streptomyces lycii]
MDGAAVLKAVRRAAAAVTAALLVTGCGGSGDSGDDKAAAGGEKTAEASQSPAGGDGGDAAGAGKPDGTWVSTLDDSPGALVVNGQRVATVGQLTRNGTEQTCSGMLEADAAGGKLPFTLRCTSGQGDATPGGTLKVSDDGQKLSVEWQDGSMGLYKRGAPGAEVPGAEELPDLPKLDEL